MSYLSCPRVAVAIALLIFAFVCGGSSHAQSAQPLIDHERPAAWRTLASEGVALKLTQVAPEGSPALKIEYSFEAGAGFGIIRRPFIAKLGENYRFRYRIRGQGPANDLEFKLVDTSGDNVWWVNRRAFVPTDDWMVHINRRRHFEFAWGPSDGAPIEQLGWIEFAIASHDGGSGVLLIDQLEFETLPAETPYSGTPTVTDRLAELAVERPVGDEGTINLVPELRDGLAKVSFSFGSERTLSAVEIEWGETEPAETFAYSISDLDSERVLGKVAASRGGRDFVWIGECDVSGLHLDIVGATSGLPELVGIEFVEPDDAASENALLRRIATQSPTHTMPPAFHDIQTAWTVSGAPSHPSEAVLSTNGRVEFDKAGASIEPFLLYGSGDTGHIVGWDGSMHGQRLVDGSLPIPIVTRSDGLTDLQITVVSTGDHRRSACLVEYAITNTTGSQLDATLMLATRPLQVLPHWQRLNVIGGFSPMRSVSVSASTLLIDGARPVFSLTTADGAVAWDLQDAPLPSSSLADPAILARLEQVHGFAAAAWTYALSLAPGETARVLIEAPYADTDGNFTDEPSADTAGFDTALAQVRTEWNELLSPVSIRLPARAAHLESSIASTIAYLLVNRDGPALQPGSRTYERAWIRDGSISSAALLAFGHEDVVREYLDWYAGYTFESGKVPCVVDHRGPDPVDEHDSTGQLLFALARHARTTGDRSLLAKHESTIASAVAYLEDLIAQRSSEAFRGTAYYGLVPESISHEGYSAKPMHSYWDCFFVLQGLRDAAWIAGALGDESEQVRRQQLADTFAESLKASIVLAAREQGVGYIPGCVELGDYDPTSTAVALAPLQIADALPADLLATTLNMYTEFFETRRLGEREWFDYTPYELRVIGAMHTAGRHGEAHRMTDWFLSQQTPVGWNQWPEVVYADSKYPGFVGDIPHTWCATGLVNSFLTGLIHATDDSLVIGSGIPESWYQAQEGFSIEGLRTEYGALNLSARATADHSLIAFELAREQARERAVLFAVPTGLIGLEQIQLNGVVASEFEIVRRAGREYLLLPARGKRNVAPNDG